MARKVDPRDFLLNTDFEMDKIIYFKEEKLTSHYQSATIPHSLGFAPLIIGVWSETADFAVPHPFSPIDVVDPSNGTYPIKTVTCYITEETIEFLCYFGSLNNPTDFTFYVRLYGFEPSDVNKNVPKTSFNANTFVLNTDYNYLKLYEKGVKDIDISGQYPAAVTITHNLGYVPQALFWLDSIYGQNHELRQFDILTTVYQTTYNGTTTTIPKMGVECYDDRFVIKPSQPAYNGQYKLHYRIYYDED